MWTSGNDDRSVTGSTRVRSRDGQWWGRENCPYVVLTLTDMRDSNLPIGTHPR